MFVLQHGISKSLKFNSHAPCFSSMACHIFVQNPITDLDPSLAVTCLPACCIFVTGSTENIKGIIAARDLFHRAIAGKTLANKVVTEI